MRLSIALLLAFIFLNASVGMIEWTTGGDLGVEPKTGDPANLEGLEPQGADAGTTEDGTLLGLQLGLGTQLYGWIATIAPAVDMLDAAGVPDEILGWVFAALGLYTSLDLMGFLRNGALLQS